MTSKNLRFFRSQCKVFFLKMDEPGNPRLGHFEKTQEIFPRKDVTLAGSLNFHVFSPFVQNHVAIYFGSTVFVIIKIEKQTPPYSSHTYCSHEESEGDARQGTFAPKASEGIRQSYEGSGNGSGTGASIRLEYIAIDPDGALPQKRKIHRSPKRASDKALYFLGPALDLPHA
jgi:hypothetical protein